MIYYTHNLVELVSVQRKGDKTEVKFLPVEEVEALVREVNPSATSQRPSQAMED